ncbi:MAG: hypothetical protein VX265_01455, partial [Myxococcota bacterium]|nr:hypothetical protein [Myxococcota bacterium]
MSRNRRHGTASATTLLWVALCLVSFGVLSVWTVESRAGAIQADIERRAREAVRSAPGFDLRIEADGRDVALRGRVGSETDRDAVVSRLLVVEGIRVIEDDLKVI